MIGSTVTHLFTWKLYSLCVPLQTNATSLEDAFPATLTKVVLLPETGVGAEGWPASPEQLGTWAAQRLPRVTALQHLALHGADWLQMQLPAVVAAAAALPALRSLHLVRMMTRSPHVCAPPMLCAKA